MLKTVCSVLTALVLILSLAACGAAPSGQPAAPAPGDAPAAPADTEAPAQSVPDGAVTLKFGHVLAPGTPQHQGIAKFEELVEERTNGAVQIEIYPSSQLGDERELIEGMQMGTVDGYLGSTATMTAWIPDFMVFDIPFLFDGYEHEYKVMDGQLGDKLKEECLPLGVHVLTISDAGFSNIINNGHPIEKPEDAKGMNIRVMESPGLIAYMNALGANPVPMAMSEVFTALQNGTLDGGTWPVVVAYFNKFYTATDYMTLIDPIPTSIMTAMSESAWNSVPEEYHDILTQASIEATAYQRQVLAESIDSLTAVMEEEGVTIIRPDRDVWRDALQQKCLDAMVPKYVPQELIDTVNADK
ncbi:TRAP transporter substrate-binding protein [Anaerotruncus massiliensis (ex Togo et al. 2019)]|uniref:TRAP transporter substrate-binding protein n=1 Tax=Anaerotruncus massiliensis (ex Togo et al. 2019) TaxID=1673720 RepID=UPI0027B92E71|nr:TRAP transporter substrate-binding protein [Anaerotruncus massiliensis (ex Togo et al. 2019)]